MDMNPISESLFYLDDNKDHYNQIYTLKYILSLNKAFLF